MLKKHIFIIGLFVYLIIIFVSEAFYREKLYQISVEYIEKINQSGYLKYFFYFWSYIYLYGMLAIGCRFSFIFISNKYILLQCDNCNLFNIYNVFVEIYL